MDDKSLKIGIACASGGGIGTFLMSGLVPHLWWIGLLVGMLAGYLLYDPKEVIKAVPLALKDAWSTIPSFQSTSTFVKKVWEKYIYFMLIISSLTVPFIMLILMVSSHHKDMFFGLIFGFAYPVILPLFFVVVALLDGKSLENFSGENALKYNFFTVYFYHLPKFLLTSIPGLVFTFLKKLFILIHSDERLLCMVNAGIGCAIGHVYWNMALVGMISGGLAGVMSYEIVSKRILKVVPAIPPEQK